MVRNHKFGLVLSQQEQTILFRLARQERISAAAVMRRLLWKTAQPEENWDEEYMGRIEVSLARNPETGSPIDPLGLFEGLFAQPTKEER